jgi:ornithine cyclodeaminase/alanine dehydrogenase-like protein (mu-crystallin family)
LHNEAVTVILVDDEIRSRLNARDAVQWMGEAIDDHHRGNLVAPPRSHADLRGGRIAFTSGQLRGSWFGYRSYDTFQAEPGEQVVVVHDEATGTVRAIAVGNELGPLRTGAIGAVAADAMSPPDATVAAIIGTGTQAATQLWALSAVRNLSEIRVFSRDNARRDSFVERAQSLTSAECHSASSARTAVNGADIVILATNSPTPVIEADWLASGAFVTTLGPKQRGRAEFGLDLPAIAATIVTDSVAQIDAYDPPNVLVGTPQRDRLVSLGAVRAGEVARPELGRISLFLSVGLAGTEVYLLNRLIVSAGK